jgi:hypothetical protein
MPKAANRVYADAMTAPPEQPLQSERPMESGWLPDTPVEDSVLRRFLFNQADAQELMARAVGGRAELRPDVALSDLGVPAPFLNQALLLRPVTSVDDPLLDEVSAFFRGGPMGVALSVWPTPDLSGRGWHLVGHPMFVAHGGPVNDAPPPADVTVQLATSAADLALVERLVVDGYPIPELGELPANSVLGADLIGTPLRHRIGLLEGQPVAAVASHVAHGVVNLCLAATLPAARRRGVWQALVAARCADAPELPAVAFTSDDSRPGFIRMGFLPICRFTLWAVPG